MDSANLDHHHQSHHVAPSLHLSSFLASASSHSWNPNLLLNHGYTENSVQAIQMFNPEFAGLNMSSVNVANEHDAMVQLPTVTHPELDQFNTWGTNSENYSQYVRIKEELEDSVSNFHGFQRSSGELYADHPPISLDYSGAAVTSGNSLWAQQNLPPANFSSQNLHATSGNYRPTEIGCLGRVDLNYLQQPINIPVSNNEKKRSGVMNEATQGIKRNSSTPQTKTSEGSSKRPRLESSTSMPPLKVRKEKLGDRISALQQLVSPFGKTDTASVLKEAIGYIKFLHSQVETLSVPYLRSSSSSSSGARAIQGVPNKAYCSAGEEKEEDEVNRNLRSRGLCLVPLSCMSHLSNDHVGALWPHTNFGGP